MFGFFSSAKRLAPENGPAKPIAAAAPANLKICLRVMFSSKNDF
jgi:hypothetical protein